MRCLIWTMSKTLWMYVIQWYNVGNTTSSLNLAFDWQMTGFMLLTVLVNMCKQSSILQNQRTKSKKMGITVLTIAIWGNKYMVYGHKLHFTAPPQHHHKRRFATVQMTIFLPVSNDTLENSYPIIVSWISPKYASYLFFCEFHFSQMPWRTSKTPFIQKLINE